MYESLVGKTIGFIGLGRIGLAIAQRLKPFGIGEIVYSNRKNNEEAEAEVLMNLEFREVFNYH